MAKKKAALGLEQVQGEEEIPHIDLSNQAPVEQADNEEYVKITIPVRVKIKRTVYNPGTHKIPKHLMPTMMEMVDKKRRADLEIFTGKNYFVQKLLDRSLVVSEVESLDLKKLAR